MHICDIITLLTHKHGNLVRILDDISHSHTAITFFDHPNMLRCQLNLEQWTVLQFKMYVVLEYIYYMCHPMCETNKERMQQLSIIQIVK